MTPEVCALWAVAGDVHFPAVSVGRLVVHGRAAWARAIGAIPPATPQECRVLLRGLEKHLLVATPGGRARLRAWLDAKRAATAPPLSVSARREHIVEHALTYGDEHMHAQVISALMRLPEYVADAAMREAVFLLVGGRTRGWCGTGPLPADRVPILVAGGDDVERTVLHECAHLFNGDLPTEHTMIPLWNRARAVAVARAAHWPVLEHLEQRHAQDERLARGLEEIWSAR